MKTKAHLFWIAAIIVVLFLGFVIVRTVANDTLGAKVEKASAAFTDGVMATDGSMIPSISDALYKRLDASDTLQTLAAKVDGIYDSYTKLRTAHNDLLALLKSNGDYADMQAADAKLTEAFDRCYEAIAPYVSGKSAAAREASAAGMKEGSAALKDAAEAYNSFILGFREMTMSKFPNSILKLFLQAEEPQLWP